MSTTSAGPTFQCGQCGRTMKWSPAIAGKRGKCKCGATVQVPESIEEPFEEDPLGALDIPMQPVDEAVQGNVTHQPALAPLAYAAPAPGATAAVATDDLVREIFIPTGVLVLGFGLLLAWLFNQGAFYFAAVVTAVLLASLLMVVKTVLLSVFAWALARRSMSSGRAVRECQSSRRFRLPPGI